MKRVVITGMSAICPIGMDWQSTRSNLAQGITGIRTMTDWEVYPDLLTRLAAPALEEPTAAGEVAIVNVAGDLVALGEVTGDGRTLRPAKVFASTHRG